MVEYIMNQFNNHHNKFSIEQLWVKSILMLLFHYLIILFLQIAPNYPNQIAMWTLGHNCILFKYKISVMNSMVDRVIFISQQLFLKLNLELTKNTAIKNYKKRTCFSAFRQQSIHLFLEICNLCRENFINHPIFCIGSTCWI